MFLISRKNAIREKREIKSDANITTYTVCICYSSSSISSNNFVWQSFLSFLWDMTRRDSKHGQTEFSKEILFKILQTSCQNDLQNKEMAEVLYILFKERPKFL